MLWNLDSRIRHSYNNSILRILSVFLCEIEALSLKYASHKYKVRNKGTEIPLSPKKYQIF